MVAFRGTSMMMMMILSGFGKPCLIYVDVCTYCTKKRSIIESLGQIGRRRLQKIVCFVLTKRIDGLIGP